MCAVYWISCHLHTKFQNWTTTKQRATCTCNTLNQFGIFQVRSQTSTVLQAGEELHDHAKGDVHVQCRYLLGHAIRIIFFFFSLKNLKVS